MLPNSNDPFNSNDPLNSNDPGRLGPLVGTSPVMQDLFAQIRRFAPVDSPVLISGETGTGKELVAQTLHRLSTRHAGPFVPLNCAAIPRGLIEAELFGSEPGAYTGARHRSGLFRQADGGTLFLDELGELELSAQAVLLRVLETREVVPLGGTQSHRSDFRLLCATHQRLSLRVSRGIFRADLFHRVSALAVHLPPLRDRLGDLRDLCRELLKPDPPRLGLAAIGRLESHHWPGNVRELRNVLIRARAEAEGGAIEPRHVVFSACHAPAPGSGRRPLRIVMAGYVRNALAGNGGNVRATARQLEISPTTLYRHLALLDRLPEGLGPGQLAEG